MIDWPHIDPGIKWVVRAFNREGFKTSGSCEGHVRRVRPAESWVNFSELDSEKYRIMHQLVQGLMKEGVFKEVFKTGRKWYIPPPFHPPFPQERYATRVHSTGAVLTIDFNTFKHWVTGDEAYGLFIAVTDEGRYSESTWRERCDKVWSWLLEELRSFEGQR